MSEQTQQDSDNQDYYNSLSEQDTIRNLHVLRGVYIKCDELMGACYNPYVVMSILFSAIDVITHIEPDYCEDINRFKGDAINSFESYKKKSITLKEMLEEIDGWFNDEIECLINILEGKQEDL